VISTKFLFTRLFGDDGIADELGKLLNVVLPVNVVNGAVEVSVETLDKYNKLACC
jgi:hypothetical protein